MARGRRGECIRARPDVSFSIITKRILRAGECLPPDWGAGYENVEIGLTCENQRRAKERMEAFSAPAHPQPASSSASRCWGR